MLCQFVGLDVRYSYGIYAAAVAATIALTVVVAHETPLSSPSPVKLRELVDSFYVSRATHGDFYWVFWMRSAPRTRGQPPWLTHG